MTETWILNMRQRFKGKKMMDVYIFSHSLQCLNLVLFIEAT